MPAPIFYNRASRDRPSGGTNRPQPAQPQMPRPGPGASPFGPSLPAMAPRPTPLTPNFIPGQPAPGRQYNLPRQNPFGGVQGSAGVTPTRPPVLTPPGSTPASRITPNMPGLMPPGSPGGGPSPLGIDPRRPVGPAAPAARPTGGGVPQRALDAEASRLTGMANAMGIQPNTPAARGMAPAPGAMPGSSLPPRVNPGDTINFAGGMAPPPSIEGGFGPFASRAAWEQAFAAEHGGRMPTEQDVYDALDSFDFAAQTGRSPTMRDWLNRYYYNEWGGGVPMAGGEIWNQQMGGAPQAAPAQAPALGQGQPWYMTDWMY